MDNQFDDDRIGPASADSEYDDVMAKLNASLKRSATSKSNSTSLVNNGVNGSFRGTSDGSRRSNSRISNAEVIIGNGLVPPHHIFGSTMHDVNVDDYDLGEQLPSLEEARIHAATTSRSRMDPSVITSRYSFDAAEEEYEEQYKRFLRDRGYSDEESTKRTIPWYRIAFFALLASILGIIIGAAVGFSAGESVEKRQIQGGLTNAPSVAAISNVSTSLMPAPPVTPPVAAPNLSPVAPSPSAPPEPTRIHSVMKWLVDKQIVKQTDFTNPSSYQFQAARWIAGQDAANLTIPTTVGDSASFEFIERFVMVAFYFATKGSSWQYPFYFLEERHVCKWNVNVSPPPAKEILLGVACDSENRITSINIPQNNLVGSLIEELGFLTRLDMLALNHNVLAGSIPDKLAELTGLDYLALHYNTLIGTLPSWIGDLNELRVLGLGDNNFSGTIPKQWNSLSNLVTFAVDTNSLKGEITALSGMVKLKRAYLDDNNLQQTLGDISWDQMTDLEELDMSGNLLDGPLPSELLTLTNLRVLDLGQNSLSGELPSFPSMRSIVYLGLYSNELKGSIPSTLRNLENLTHLDLSDNQFTSHIPEDLVELTNLQYLFLGDNTALSQAKIPPFVSSLTNIRDLSFRSSNRVADILPSLFAQLNRLVLLELDHNDLTGKVPSELGSISTLTYLLLNDNDLSGSVPVEIQNLPDLDVIMLGFNSMTGDLDVMCSNDRTPEISIADCFGDSPQVSCECCSVCCEEGINSTDCRDKVYLGQLDPSWESSFQRRFYQFADDDFGDDAGSSYNHIGHVGHGDVLGIGNENKTTDVEAMLPDDR